MNHNKVFLNNNSFLNEIYNSFIQISKVVKYENTDYLNKELDNSNDSQDIIKQIDIISNNIIVNHLLHYDQIIGYISEEEKDLKFLRAPHENKDNYILCFDPLDGSKNIESNVTVGTIYCLFKYDYKKKYFTEIIEAGYALYGPKTILVKTNQAKEVEMYLLNEKDIFVKQKNLHFDFSNNEKLYAINTSNNYDNDIQQLIRYYNANNYNQRWIGSMVADCHQILLKGGVFLYPHSNKYSNGKLRLIYEVIPFSYIFECAGGKGLDLNYNPILKNFLNKEIDIDKLHKRSSIILVSGYEYNNIENIVNIYENMQC
jgi:fructose-1,6-bisphosphatase I